MTKNNTTIYLVLLLIVLSFVNPSKEKLVDNLVMDSYDWLWHNNQEFRNEFELLSHNRQLSFQDKFRYEYSHEIKKNIRLGRQVYRNYYLFSYLTNSTGLSDFYYISCGGFNFSNLDKVYTTHDLKN
jgi:hypothetical protein